MEISVSELGNDRVITIRVDEQLDCSAHSEFIRACRLAEMSKPGEVVIDLNRTRRIADSGLAMLIMLRHRLGKVRNRILLVNCRPELRKVLSLIHFPTQLRIA